MQTTARDITTKALRLLKVIAANEAGDAADLDVCLRSLNEMLDSLSLEPNAILSTVVETFTPTGLLEYSIGPTGNFVTASVPTSLPILVYTLNGVDYTVEPINEDQYAQIPVKATAGLPLYYWFNKGTTLAYLDLWPAPSRGTLTLHSLKPMAAFADLDTVTVMAPGYMNMLAYNLACDVAPMFDADPSKTVILKAMNYKRTLKRSNVVVPIMDISQVPTGDNWGYSNWRFQ